MGAPAIRHHLLGASVPLQRFLQEFQRSLLVARLRHEAFEHLSFVVDGPPKTVPLAVNLHKDLVKVPSPAARPNPRNPTLSDFRGEHRSEAVSPKPDRPVTDFNAAFVQEFFDVTKR